MAVAGCVFFWLFVCLWFFGCVVLLVFVFVGGFFLFFLGVGGILGGRLCVGLGEF